MSELNYSDEVKKHGSIRKAAAANNVPYSTFQWRLSRDQFENMPVVAASVLQEVTDDDGKITRTWVKHAAPKVQQAKEDFKAVISEMIEAAKEDLKPVQVDAPMWTNDDMLQLYTISDLHVGGYSWHEETGHNWDLDICETVAGAVINAMAGYSDAGTAILNLQGDYVDYHYKPLTPRNKHVLDVDGRNKKVWRVSVRIARRAIEKLLTRHKKVIVWAIPGNHDEEYTDGFQELLEAVYEDNERVVIDASPKPHKVYEFGKVLLCATHGHLRRFDNWDTMFAAQYREAFGRTKFAYAHGGHYHSKKEKESNLMTSVQHPTICPPNAHCASGGWVSAQRALTHFYHKDFGEVACWSVSPEMAGVSTEQK